MGTLISPSEIGKIGQTLVVGLLALSCVLPITVRAQPNPSTSFDPKVNPLLIPKDLIYSNGGEYTDAEEPGARKRDYRKASRGPGNDADYVGTLQADQKFRVCTPAVWIDGSKVEESGCEFSDGGTTVGGDVKTTTELTATAAVEAVPNAILGVAGEALAAVSYFILMLASFLLWIIGAAFNWVITVTVFEFGAYFGASANMLVAWGVLRDIGNIVLLFGFIFMGVLTVLNLHDYPVKKTIPSLIMFAVLLNFSLFAAQVVIDVSNVFSSVFYEQASGSCPDTMTVAQCAQASDSGISGMVLQQAGISSIFSIVPKNYDVDSMSKGLIFLGLALFVTITAIVLLAATIMLVIRAVVLSFLMVVSPIGFAGMAIPPLKGFAKDWWHQLINQAFFAPILLLLIFISLKITETLTQGVGGENGLANALAGGKVNGMGIVISFALIIGFMVMSLVAAKKIGAMGAGFATKTAGGLVGGATLGAAGFVGRRTVGLGSAAVAKSIRSSALGRSEIGRQMATFADKGAHASFDARNLKAVSGLAGAGGIDLGKGQKGGVHAEEEKAVKARLDYAKSLQPSAEEKAREDAIKAAKKAAEINYKETQQELQGKIQESNKKVEAAKKELADATAHDAEERTAQRRKLATAEDQLMSAQVEGDPEKIKRAEANVARERSALDALVSEQTAAATTRRAMVEAETASLANLNQKMEQTTKDHKEVLERADKDLKTAQNAGKTEYARRLEKPNAFTRLVNEYSLGGHASHEAAEKIVKEASKSKLDKIFDDLKGEMSSSKGGGDDHGHGGGDSGSHAAPKPAAKKADTGGGHDHH